MKRKYKFIILPLIIFIFFGYKIYNYNNSYSPNINLKKYLGVEYQKLNNKQIVELNQDIKDINNLKININNYNLYEDKILILNNKIKSFGINMPYANYEEFLSNNKNKLSTFDYNKILEISRQINKIENEIDYINKSSKINKLYSLEDDKKELENLRAKILIKNNFNPYDLKEEIENSSLNYNIIDINNNELVLTKDLSNKGDIIMYEKLFEEIKKIIPDNYLSYISKMKIFTDGSENILAYVIQESEEDDSWTISVDLIDSIDYKGNINKDLEDTLIHELMHIITLNHTQTLKKLYYFEETYTIDEGSMKSNSYLNMFFEKFWKDHKDQINYQNRPNLSEEEKEEYTANFYLNHKDEFVSDYAATSPVEDIAETFMFFVKEDKPQKNTTRDEKIKFMYNFKELVDIRDFIRNNLDYN